MCKYGDVLSLAVLIGRKLDHFKGLLKCFEALFSFESAWEAEGNAPLAQLVEHLTLNQGVPGSSP